jgi:hypothetical protein
VAARQLAMDVGDMVERSFLVSSRGACGEVVAVGGHRELVLGSHRVKPRLERAADAPRARRGPRARPLLSSGYPNVNT